jgi:hypothetical protein
MATTPQGAAQCSFTDNRHVFGVCKNITRMVEWSDSPDWIALRAVVDADDEAKLFTMLFCLYFD